ncbi:MAG: relaxase/mobilization nuclease domain-containing protein [Prolixibacteraceae bacterium]
MVIVIHQASSTANAFFYNERKAKEGKATFYHSRNTTSANPFIYSTQHRHQIFKRIEDANARVKNKGLHISFNPTMNDMIRLGEKGIRTELDNLMKQLGYGNQPYFVYRHADIDRVHFHIVSIRIDKQSGKKIKDNFEKEKVQKFIKELEQAYQLKNDDPKEKIDLKFTAYSKNLKQNLENLFTELNRMDFITSKQMYNDALKLFHIEIRQVQKGHLVFVTDGNENPIRHPVKMSDFEEKPKFYLSEQRILGQQSRKYPDSELIGQSIGVLKSLVLKELILQVKTQFDDGSGFINKRYKLKSQKNKSKRKL